MSLIKSKKEVELMAQAGKIWAKTMQELETMLKPGISTKEVDSRAKELIEGMQAKPAFLNYKPAWAKTAFPASICASVNEVIVHGIPSDYRLKEGDIFTIDMGVNYQGYNVDAAKTFVIGQVSKEVRELISATKLALERALNAVQPGNTLGDIGFVVSSTAKEFNLSVAEGLTGHGIGQEVHEEPTVLNEGSPGEGQKLEAGMCLAIEPMFCLGGGKIKKLDHDESYAAADNSFSAHFEHTIVVTDDGARILTKL